MAKLIHDIPTPRDDCSRSHDLTGSELTETEIRAIDDRFLNGRKIGRTDAEKLRMIDEVLRRKKTLKTQAHIVRRWLGERGLLTPAEKLNTPLEKL